MMFELLDSFDLSDEQLINIYNEIDGRDVCSDVCDPIRYIHDAYIKESWSEILFTNIHNIENNTKIEKNRYTSKEDLTQKAKLIPTSEWYIYKESTKWLVFLRKRKEKSPLDEKVVLFAQFILE